MKCLNLSNNRVKELLELVPRQAVLASILDKVGESASNKQVLDNYNLLIKTKNPNITVLPNGNLKIVAFRTENTGLTSKGNYQRGKGLYLSLDKPYIGEGVYTVEFEISPENLLDRELGLGKISEDYFINEKNKRVDKNLDTLHEFKQSLGIKAEIGSIDGALLNEIVLFDKELINKALSSKPSLNPEVNFQLKAVNILSSPKADEIFRKGDKNGWSLEKMLTELAIPKEQQELIKSFDTRNREEILTSLLANYSYTIEINVTKENAATFNKIQGYDTSKVDITSLRMEESDWGKSYIIVDKYGNHLTPLEYTKEEAEEILAGIGKVNTQYYSNLTVPGGTNYTENEISTPAITPSIKGHGQFSTDKGIGWFRSDEKAGEKTGFDLKTDGEYGEGLYSTDSFKDINSKTRRILELQSDLFQKGRNKKDLTGIDVDYEIAQQFGEDAVAQITDEYRKKYDTSDTTENQFLQLLNKDNNWVTFFIKSIIQDSAKKGYERVLFPLGNTASKIEGHTTLEQFKKQKEDRIKELEIADNRYDNWLQEIDEKGNLTGRKAPNKELAEKRNFKNTTELIIDRNQNEINQLKQELERVNGPEGFGALKPIYNFYENTVTNILKKNYKINKITDEYGNTWNEVEIKPEHLDTILAQASLSPLSYLKKALSINSKRISNLQKNMILGRLKKLNAKLGTSHSINFKQIGQADIFEYEIVERWNGHNPFQQQLLQAEAGVEIPDEEINSMLKQFLGKFGVSVEKYEQLTHKGIDVVALANITKRLIQVAQGKEDKFTLPEETGHIALALLGQNNPLFQRLLTLTRQSGMLAQVKEDNAYKSLYGDNESLYEIEAAGKLLSEALVKNGENMKESKSFLESFMKTVSLVWEFIKRQFRSANVNELDSILDLLSKGILTGKGEIIDQMDWENIDSFYKDVSLARTEVDVIKTVISRAKETLQRNIAIHKKANTSVAGAAHIEELEKLSQRLDFMDTKEAIAEFTAVALHDLDNLSKRIDKFVAEYESDPSNKNLSALRTAELNKFYEYSQSYSVLQDLGKLYTTDKDIRNLQNIINQRVLPLISNVEGAVERYGAEMMADELYQFVPESANISKDDFREMAAATSGDISWGEMMMDSINNTTDAFIAAVTKMVKFAKHNVREVVLNEKNEVIDAINTYKAESGYKGKPEDMFSFMLLKDENGKPVAEYVQKPKRLRGGKLSIPHNYKFSKMANQMYKDLRATEPNSKERIDVIEKYLDLKTVPANIKQSIYNMSVQTLVSRWRSDNRNNPTYIDDSYNKFTAAEKKFYEFWVAKKEQHDKLLNPSIQTRVRGKLPLVPKGWTDKFASATKKERIQMLKDAAYPSRRWGSNAPQDELYTQSGQVARFIPTEYLNQVEDIDTNIGNTLLAYIEMTQNYSYMKEIEERVKLSKFLIGNRNVTPTDWRGNPRRDKLTGGEAPPIKGRETKAYRQFVEWLEVNIYNEGQVQEDKFGINVSKLANDINKYSVLKSMVGNVVSAVSNVTIGRYHRLIEAVTGGKFTPEAWLKANGVYFKEIVANVSDILSERPSTKPGMFVAFLDLTNSFDEAVKNNKVPYGSSKLRRMFTTSNMLFLNTMGDHMLQVTTALAFGSKYTLLNGEVVNMYDECKVENGKLVWSDKVTAKDRFNFAEKTRKINQALDGIYNLEDRAIAQRYALGRLALLYRKFLVPNIRRRWGNSLKPEYNFQSEEMEEGTYVSLYKFMTGVVSEIKAVGFSKQAWDNNMNATENFRVVGARKASLELLTLLTLALVIRALKDGIDDDDEPVYAFTFYQLNRMYMELGALSPISAPTEFFKLVKSPAAGISVAQDTWRLVTDMFHPLDRFEGGAHEGDLKIYWHTLKMLPIINQYKKLQDMNEQTKGLQSQF